MIRKLKRRIIAINVVSMGMVLFLAVLLLFSIGFGRVNAEREKRMNFALDYNPAVDEPFDKNRLFNDFVLIFYNLQTKQITEQYLGAKFVPESVNLEKTAEEVVVAERDRGLLHARIAYTRQIDGDVVRIVITDYSGSANSLTAYLFMTVGILLVCLLCYFVISWLLAHTALGPVEESWAKQKQFVADASHELKTPLAVIMANTDMIAAHQEETVASQMKWVENTRTEAKRMADLVADLLFLAKNDDGLKVATADVDFSDCVGSVVLGYDAIFYENNKKFTYNIQDNVHLEGNSGQFKQLVTILLDNANRYSLEDGDIKLCLAASGKHVQLSVANNCLQLAPEQLAHLFDRFYTVDLSRNKNNSGNGLGLAIAQTICQTHGGNLRVLCVDGRITFTATFPLRRPRNSRN